MFVSCPDLMLNQLVTTYLPSDSRAYPESEFKCTNSDYTCIELNDTGSDPKMICLDHFGEQIHSIRSCLMRFQISGLTGPHAAAANGCEYHGKIIPDRLPSYSATVLWRPTIYGHFCRCYVGERGGWRKRIGFYGADFAVTDQVNVSLDPPSTSTAARSIAAVAAGSPNIYEVEGTCAFAPFTNAGIEFEIPFYSTNLYVLANCDDPYNNTLDPCIDPHIMRNYKINIQCKASAAMDVVEHSAVADGFCFLGWTAPPSYTHQ